MLNQYLWSALSPAQQQDLLQRPPSASVDEQQCRSIIDQVRTQGDSALFELTRRFDKIELESLQVDLRSIQRAPDKISKTQRDALLGAIENIRGFHQQQIQNPEEYQPAGGVRCEIVHRPIGSVGLYVPGGTAPLPSTVLMLGIPSQLAQCPVRVLCTPPQADGKVDPVVLAAAQLCGIEQVFCIGGAQAIAAMAYGTESVPKVNKIFGPGNPWVTKAKQLVAQDPDGAGLDLPAGPSEVLVLADQHANAGFVAADLLAQAEHGVDSQVILVTDSQTLADRVQQAVKSQLPLLTRETVAAESLTHSRAVVTDTLAEAVLISNRYAPEHLIINTSNARQLLAEITNAGSVFLGQWSPESIGDYCSGTNHVLPTDGNARHVSGVSVADFQKRISVQELNQEGLKNIGWIAETLAEAEGLDAHARAVSIRYEKDRH